MGGNEILQPKTEKIQYLEEGDLAKKKKKKKKKIQQIGKANRMYSFTESRRIDFLKQKEKVNQRVK